MRIFEAGTFHSRMIGVPFALTVCLIWAGCTLVNPALGPSAGASNTPTSVEPTTLPPVNTPAPTQAQPADIEPPPEIPELAQEPALLDEFVGDLELMEEATRYRIQVVVDVDPAFQNATIDGWAEIDYFNNTREALTEIPFMLWPNDEQYQSNMVAGPVFTDGKPIETRTDPEGLVLWASLPEEMAPGEEIRMSIPFTITAEAFDPFNPKRFGLTEEMLLAPTFYPLIPRYLDEAWQVENAPPGGDTTNSDVALYQVEVIAPVSLGIAVSGVEVQTDRIGDKQRVVSITGPMRDISMSVGSFIPTSRTVDDVELRFWLLEDHQEDLDTVERAASEQMELMSRLVGPYPYPELDILDAPWAYGGIEYPGLIYVGTIGTSWVVEPTVHEVAHQWFYGLIGNDQITEPWLDEALATYSEALYYELAIDPGRAVSFLTALRLQLQSNEDPEQPIGLGVAEYPSEMDYAEVVYLKGALFIDALRTEMGDPKFFEFLQTYYVDQRYQVASSQDFQALAEDTCECDLEPLFDLWVFEGGQIPGITD